MIMHYLVILLILENVILKPDWLLVYTIDDEELELFLFRTGTHSDLF